MAKKQYTPQERALRAEFTRVRDIVNKRVKRLQAKAPEHRAVRNLLTKYGGEVPKLANMKNDVDIARAYNDLKQFLEAPTKVRQIPQFEALMNSKEMATVKKFRDKGYTWVTLDNLQTVLDYLQDYHSRNDAKMFDSDEVIDTAIAAESLGINKSLLKSGYIDYEKVRKNMESKIKKLRAKGKEISDSAERYQKLWM